MSLPNVLVADGDAWLTQAEIATLFGVSVKTVSEHVCGILADGEVKAVSTVRNFRKVQTEGVREVSREVAHYSSDMALAIGYRVRSSRGVEFRQWVTRVVKGEVEAPAPKAALTRAPTVSIRARPRVARLARRSRRKRRLPSTRTARRRLPSCRYFGRASARSGAWRDWNRLHVSTQRETRQAFALPYRLHKTNAVGEFMSLSFTGRATMRAVPTDSASRYPSSPEACPACGRGANEPCRHGRKGHSRVMCSARRPAPGFRHDGQPMFSEAERLALRNAKFTAELSA